VNPVSVRCCLPARHFRASAWERWFKLVLLGQEDGMDAVWFWYGIHPYARRGL